MGKRKGRRPSGPFYDGKIHVLSDKCSTCVFRPKNLMQLRPGRMKDLVESNLKDDTALTCHQTLSYGGTDTLPAVCRGFYDGPGQKVTPLQLAQRLGAIEEVAPPKKED